MSIQRTGKRELFRKTLVGRAREMRGHLTAAELRLWDKLRGDQLPGLRFRRQHRIGSYIADFYCPAAKLVVEVDGDSHDERQTYDEKRTHWMSREKGVRVVRYTNDDVMKHLDAVLENIADWCSHMGQEAAVAAQSATPSPRVCVRGERGGKGQGACGVEHRSIPPPATDRRVERSPTPYVARPSPRPSPRSTGERE